MALSNLWGSYFSRIEPNGAMSKPFRRGAYNRVTLRVGETIGPEQCQPETLRQRVLGLLERQA